MKISQSDWKNYVGMLSKLNSLAGEEMQACIDMIGYDDVGTLINYAYDLTTKYGEASSALACEMYDLLAQAQGAILPPAEPAKTASYGEVAKAINGTAHSNNMPNAVSRLVKRTASDTMCNNAIRDGAEWAWIPSGDSCAFCITLASQGWVRASKKLMKGGHAEHIHANCDCEFAIRFDGKSSVSGYDPNVYKRIYYDADGKTPQERINAIRRSQYRADAERSAKEEGQ